MQVRTTTLALEFAARIDKLAGEEPARSFIAKCRAAEGDPAELQRLVKRAPLNWRTSEQSPAVQTALLKICGLAGIDVKINWSFGNAGQPHGVSHAEVDEKGEIHRTIELAPNAGTATLAHEMFHGALHQSSFASRLGNDEEDVALHEVEAELCTYEFCRVFGLDATPSVRYVALSGAPGVAALKAAKRVWPVLESFIEAAEHVGLVARLPADFAQPEIA